jgi:uncharacterized protein YlxW (UPF0749 family)
MTPPPARKFAPNFLLELFNNPLDPGYADAARRRAEVGPRPPWRRRGAYALRVIAVASIGFLLTVAYREVVISRPLENTVHAGLVNQAKAAQARTDQLQGQADDLRRKVSAAQANLLGGSAELDQLRQQEAATGLGAVTGSGIVVHLTDAPTPIDPTTGKASTGQVNRILDIDLQAVANALWAGGAEAIAINGQRLTATSAIRTAGSAILVDFRPLTSPYDVSAIGPADLTDVFNASAEAAALRGLVQQYGLGFSAHSEDHLQLPAASSLSLNYAHPPLGGSR